ncbi:excinuclease ABC subunit A [Paraburkholderia flava]|uniref:excinuclease ABC subunit A n=1 Tax=Paraburkholderia flava TaxID=2547393 RepID=UPI001414E79F|nr:excinuclease ABC subunit A [Paraburkholderia flava]
MRHQLIRIALLSAVCSFAATHAFARDSIASYPVDAALHSEPGKVGDDVALYFAGQSHPAVAQSLGEVATNRKTNAFGKSDADACQHVFLSAVIALQDSARKQGANAVINIKSNYHNEERASATEFMCGAGAMVAGVALKGEVVKLRK